MGLEVGRLAEMGVKIRDSGLHQPPDLTLLPRDFYRPLLSFPPEGDGKELSGTQMSPLSPKVA